MTTDVNSLFHTHTIDGIKAVEAQLRSDIEKKKQELRVLVGERYRDLINAADTIRDMETASNEVFSGLNKVSELCSQFTTDEEKISESTTERVGGEQAFYSLATQMNLLVDTPEKVWSALDRHQYLSASQLYLLSQHIVDHSLNINTGHTKTTRDIYASFPIVHHQWAAISHFKPSILKGARHSLKDATLPDKALSESLCCIALLDNYSPRQVFTEFLAARKAAIKDVFQPNLYSTSVKKQLCDITHLIKLTVEQIITMFHKNENEKQDGKEGPLFYHTLHGLTDEKASVFQSLFEEEVDVVTVSRYLPTLVSGFVPKLQSVPVSISASFIQKHSLEWLNGCIADVHEGVKTLLSFVKNIKGLASIRNAVFELLKTRDDDANEEEEEHDENMGDTESEKSVQVPWSKSCEVCFNRNLSIWDDFFRPLFLERTKGILEKEFGGCFNRLEDSLTEALGNLGDVDNKIDDTCLDHNIAGFVWNDFSTMTSGGANSEMLAMQVKGCTPAIKRLCTGFNDGLDEILEDVNYFIAEGESTKSDKKEKESKLKNFKRDIQKSLLEGADISANVTGDVTTKSDDVIAIKEELLSMLTSNLTSFCAHVTSLLTQISAELDDGKSRVPIDVTSLIDKCTFLAHLCLTMPDLCTNFLRIVDTDNETQSASTPHKTPLKKQLSRHSNLRKLPPKVADKLSLLENHLLETSERGFALWENWVRGWCEESVGESVGSSQDFYLFSMTNWEEVGIEEESEKGETVASTIGVPAQISFYLSSLLFRLAEEYHRVGGNLMEKERTHAMGLNIGGAIFQAHEKFLDMSVKEVFQNQAFQMMFDLKFLLKLFAGGADSKDTVVSGFQSKGNRLISKLETCIDPFDLNVVVPHMNTFVQRQLQATALLYGSISNLDKHVLQGHKRSTDISDQHSIVEMVDHPPKFKPLLTQSSKTNRNSTQEVTVPPCLLDYEASPLFLHQSQSSFSRLV